jgi:two-component system response regulator LytT|tara:strand:- start:1358 stop:1621 length:264 start_codon:yes stop_codon:yes gene_type:complete
MNCIVIDNDKIERVIVNILCNKIASLTLLEAFSNTTQDIKYLNENKVDFIFLDIHMLDFTKTLEEPRKIIFTTSDTQFEIKNFEYDF